MVGFNKPKVMTFFDVYNEVLEKFNFPASDIYNMDETGIILLLFRINQCDIMRTRSKV